MNKDYFVKWWIKMTELKPKYNVTFIDDYGHWYVIDGIKYPSVTSILTNVGSKGKLDGMMGWAKKLALTFVSDELKTQLGKDIVINEIFIDKVIKAGWKKPEYETQKAGDIGTRLHNIVDKYIITGKLPVNIETDLQIPFDNFIKYMKTHNLKIISGDIILGSKKYCYGGRADCIAQNEKGEYIIIDWKTSKTIKDKIEYKMQVAAYAEACKEMFGIKDIKIAYIVRFSKEVPDEFEVVEVANLDKYFDGFKAAMKLKEVSELI